VKYKDTHEWKNVGEYRLGSLPRLSEYIAIQPDTTLWYKVVSVVHVVPEAGLVEVFAVYDGNITEIQERLLEL